MNPAQDGSGDLAATFAAILESLRGVPHRAASYADAARIAAGIVRDAGFQTVAVAQLPPALADPLADALTTAGVKILQPPFDPDALDPAQAGITWAQFGIAESATVVEVATDDALRLVSALPRTHIGLLDIASLVPRLADAAPRVRDIFTEHGQNVAVSFISGPSRTGDIEMILTLGVHGPEHVHIILIGDAHDL